MQWKMSHKCDAKAAREFRKRNSLFYKKLRTTDQERQTTGKKRKGAVLMEVRNINGHYEIYKDGAFVCSCDADELKEVVEEIGE